MTDAVLYGREDRIGVITLNRPDNRNSMTPELLSAFAAAVAKARADGDARCIVITGTGNCFSAGADLKSNVQLGGERPYQRSFAMYEAFLGVLDIEVPVIGALNGHAIGGGFGLALVCDMRIVHQHSKYGANFVRLGLSPGMAISFVLPRLIGISRAAELMFTGRLISGNEAHDIGLASGASPDPARVPEMAIELGRKIAANAPLAVRATKQMLYANLGWDLRQAGMREAFLQAQVLDSDDAREGMAALLARREPQFHGR